MAVLCAEYMDRHLRPHHGADTLKNIDSVDNGGYGADLDNCLSVAGACLGSGSISVLASSNYQNMFDGNTGGDGLKAWSSGNIKVYNVSCSNNNSAGANLINEYSNGKGSVTIGTVGKNSWNSFGENQGGQGLYVASNGTISVKNLSAYDNNNEGAFFLTMVQRQPLRISPSIMATFGITTKMALPLIPPGKSPTFMAALTATMTTGPTFQPRATSQSKAQERTGCT